MQKIKILLADDHPVMRAGMRHVLAREPDLQIVGEASNPAEMERKIEMLDPAVLILDLYLPNFDPVKAVQNIKARNPKLAILILTSSDRQDFLYDLLSAGISGYATKNESPQALREAIRCIARGNGWFGARTSNDLKGIAYRFDTDKRGPAGAMSNELTERESEVLYLIGLGVDNSEIAQKLWISKRTAEAHVQRIYSKLGFSSRAQAILYCVRHEMVPLKENVSQDAV